MPDCESALDSLRTRQEGATFDSEQPELYSLGSLNDLAGVRVLAFPHNRWAEADRRLQKRFPRWTADPVAGYNELDEPLAFKYFGYCRASDRIRAEFQIVPMLTALFWEVEHAVIYKPSPRLKGVARSLEMQQRTREVLKALKAFEDEFANGKFSAQFCRESSAGGCVGTVRRRPVATRNFHAIANSRFPSPKKS